MLESDSELMQHELELFNVANSIFFIKSSTSFLSHISSNTRSTYSLSCSTPSSSNSPLLGSLHLEIRRRLSDFLSVSLSVKDGFSGDSDQVLAQNALCNSSQLIQVGVSSSNKIEDKQKKGEVSGAINTTKHLWAGAVAAMVSRTFVAPLERLKLEYIVRGEQKHLFELISTIAATQGVRGFWKGNFVNILRTAPFKSINFYAYDTYRTYLSKISGNEEAANFERFIAGAAAGITATLLCLPMDTGSMYYMNC